MYHISCSLSCAKLYGEEKQQQTQAVFSSATRPRTTFFFLKKFFDYQYIIAKHIILSFLIQQKFL